MTYSNQTGITAPARRLVPINPSDATDGSGDIDGGPVRAIYVGGAGHLRVVTDRGFEETYKNVPLGNVVVVVAVRVVASGTTATDMLGLD